MADQTIRYKIQIDDSDIAGQLSNIRKQVDAAVADSFSSSLNVNASIANATQATTLMGMGLPSTNASIGDVGGTIQAGVNRFYNDATTGFQGFVANTNNMLQNATMGYQKLTSDVSSLDNLLFPSTGYQGTMPMSMSAYDQMRTADFPNNFANTVMGVGAGLAGSAVGSTIGGVIGSALLPGIGTDVGMFAGGIVGGMVGEGALNILSGPAEQTRTLGLGLQAMGQGAFGIMSRSEAMDMAGGIVAQSRGFEAMSHGQSLGEMQRNIASFAEAGGLSNTTNADEFEAKIQSVLQNTRQMAQTLGMFQEQATAIMGELERKNISSPSNMPAMVANLQSMGFGSFTSPTELLQAGLAGSDMFRGQGFGAAAGYDAMSTARAEAGRLVRGTSDDRELIQDMGGINAAAQAGAAATMNWGLGSMGKLTIGAMAGGYGGTDLTEQMNAYAGWVGSDPTNYFAQQANQGKWSGQIGMQEKALRMAQGAVNMLDNVNYKDQYDESTLTGAMMEMYGLDSNTANFLRETAIAPNLRGTAKIAKFALLENFALTKQTTLGEDVLAGIKEIGNDIVDVFGFSDEDKKWLRTAGKDITDVFTKSDRFEAEKYKVTNSKVASYVLKGDKAIFGEYWKNQANSTDKKTKYSALAGQAQGVDIDDPRYVIASREARASYDKNYGSVTGNVKFTAIDAAGQYDEVAQTFYGTSYDKLDEFQRAGLESAIRGKTNTQGMLKLDSYATSDLESKMVAANSMKTDVEKRIVAAQSVAKNSFTHKTAGAEIDAYAATVVADLNDLTKATIDPSTQRRALEKKRMYGTPIEKAKASSELDTMDAFWAAMGSDGEDLLNRTNAAKLIIQVQDAAEKDIAKGGVSSRLNKELSEGIASKYARGIVSGTDVVLWKGFGKAITDELNSTTGNTLLNSLNDIDKEHLKDPKFIEQQGHLLTRTVKDKMFGTNSATREAYDLASIQDPDKMKILQLDVLNNFIGSFSQGNNGMFLRTSGDK